VLVAGSACSSSGPAKPAGGSGVVAPATSTSAPASPTATGAADAATTAAVTQAFRTFFGSSSTQAQAADALQNGSHFTAELTSEGASAQPNTSTATVQSVQTTSFADTVAVTFSILGNGQVLLKNDTGYAVRVGGVWKVAARTFCDLLELQGTAPPACLNSALTTLPD
jgi:hypothetical protein